MQQVQACLQVHIIIQVGEPRAEGSKSKMLTVYAKNNWPIEMSQHFARVSHAWMTAFQTSPHGSCATRKASPTTPWQQMHETSMGSTVLAKLRDAPCYYVPVCGASLSHLGDALCMEKYSNSRSGYFPKFHHILRLPWKVAPERWTSPNIAHAATNDMDDWSLSHMKPLATRCVLQHHRTIAPATKM